MMEDTPCTATVVLCTYNRAAMLGPAVESLCHQILPDGRRFEILVVDDGSTDATPDLVPILAGRTPVPLRCVRIPHGGVAAARNAGVANARGDWIAFFDDDQEAAPGWLAGLLACAEQTPADCVAGRIHVVLTEEAGARLDPTVLKLLGDNGFMAMRAANSAAGVPTVVPGTGNALARRRLFARIGPFDSTLSYGEDAEWFRRARRMGARIAFAPDAAVRHLTPASRLTPAYLFRVAARGAASRAADDLKDAGSAGLLGTCALRAGHALLSALRLAAARATGDRDATLGRACSLRYSAAYMAAAARLALGQRGGGGARAWR
ncbi:glycosyltransferase family 2 protein [Azospirillum sp.]|uniref:glycosyltransferase family 2 protein n=1 Tax=Azospirillum sp. TaxID=34012 RepID=UPI003D70B6EE